MDEFKKTVLVFQQFVDLFFLRKFVLWHLKIPFNTVKQCKIVKQWPQHMQRTWNQQKQHCWDFLNAKLLEHSTIFFLFKTIKFWFRMARNVIHFKKGKNGKKVLLLYAPIMAENGAQNCPNLTRIQVRVFSLRGRVFKRHVLNGHCKPCVCMQQVQLRASSYFKAVLVVNRLNTP